MPTSNLIVVSARSPFCGSPSGPARSPGGVVSALMPCLKQTGGTWFATGTDTEASERSDDGVDVTTIPLAPDARKAWYQGASNSAIWPLAHGFVERARFRTSEWAAYRDVCSTVAANVATKASERATVWIHDYQLALVPAMLRALRKDLTIGFFWHIPWPPHEVLRICPWAEALVDGIRGADVVGFHVPRYVRAFADALAAFDVDHTTSAQGIFVRLAHGETRRIFACPIGVDAQRWSELGASPGIGEAARRIRAGIGTERVLLAVDRLDYAKGCIERLQAFEAALEDKPTLADQMTFIQIGVPSREAIDDYRALRVAVEAQVGRINGRFGSTTRIPARFTATSLAPEDLAAYYLAADAALVTPLRDGMNLVAPEYVATRRGLSGRLLLSETAGAADLLTGARRVNPYDGGAFATAIASLGSDDESVDDVSRMATDYDVVRKNDVHAWVDGFLAALSATQHHGERSSPAGPRRQLVAPRTQEPMRPIPRFASDSGQGAQRPR